VRLPQPRMRYRATVLLLKPPGVYRPQSDTRLLAEMVHRVGIPPGAHVLDVGTGTGAVAVEAVRAGAGEVTAVDVSGSAVFAARFNTRIRRLPVRVERGDVFDHVHGRTFDLILANPPYVPAESSRVPNRGRARAWDAGRQGRALLDPLCTKGPDLLNPGGMLLVVHSTLSGDEVTLEQLEANGMTASVIARRPEPFGPVMWRRVAYLRGAGLIEPDQHSEELVVIRGERLA
jgi:release factor glutamine methyltransferase